jgi:hypothetical protein
MRLLTLVLTLGLAAASLPAAPAFQITLDVEDPAFEVLSGTWNLRNTGTNHEFYSQVISGPGDGSTQGRWIAEEYLIEYFTDNGDFPSDARIQVMSEDGVDDLMVDLNFVGAGFQSLGLFNIDGTCVVTVTDFWEGSGTQLMADSLRFTLQTALPAPPATEVPPHICLCIDDLGAANPAVSTTPIARMLALPITITYAIIPGGSFVTQSADAIEAQGSEVILHQPMAAISILSHGPLGINSDTTPAEAEIVLSSNLDTIPHVIGMNNHTGSLVTQFADVMSACMNVLLDRQLFYYDSRTYTQSVAYDVAQQRGLLTAERDRFLDGNSVSETMDLFRVLALRALHSPEQTFTAIAHVRANTAGGMENILTELDAMGVELWPLTRCLTQIVEVDFQPEGTSSVADGDWDFSSDDVLSKMLTDDFEMVADTDGTHSVTFTPNLQWPGLFDIYAIWSGDESTNAPDAVAEIHHLGGITPVPIDQTQSIGRWHYLGRFPLAAGDANSVIIADSDATAGNSIHADAVRFTYYGPITTSSAVVTY